MDANKVRVTLEGTLEDPTAWDEEQIEAAFDAALSSRQTELVELAAEVAATLPQASWLAPLRAMVDDKGAGVELREAAMHGVAGILVQALDDMEPPIMDEPLLTREEIEAEVEHMLGIYNDDGEPADIRRRALEVAANASAGEALEQAARTALGSTDPAWIQTGLLVLRLVSPEGAREPTIAALTHADGNVRIEAIRGLGYFGEPEDIDRLERLADGTRGEELTEVLQALVDVPDPRAGMALNRLEQSLRGAAAREARDAHEAWLDQWSGDEEEEVEEDGGEGGAEASWLDDEDE